MSTQTANPETKTTKPARRRRCEPLFVQEYRCNFESLAELCRTALNVVDAKGAADYERRAILCGIAALARGRLERLRDREIESARDWPGVDKELRVFVSFAEDDANESAEAVQ